MNLSRLQHFYFCGPTWIRTTDTCIFSAVLYQLSYRPNKAFLQVESSKTTIHCWQGGIRTHGGVLLVGLTARTVRPLRQPTNLNPRILNDTEIFYKPYIIRSKYQFDYGFAVQTGLEPVNLHIDSVAS